MNSRSGTRNTLKRVAWYNQTCFQHVSNNRHRIHSVPSCKGQNTGSRIGRVAPVSSSIGKAYISQHVSILRLDSKLCPDFLSMFLSLAQGGQRQIQQLQYRQTKPGLGFRQIRSFKVPVPPLDCQRKFIRIIQKYERLHAQQRESTRQAEHLFQSLLERPFKGEI